MEIRVAFRIGERDIFFLLEAWHPSTDSDAVQCEQFVML